MTVQEPCEAGIAGLFFFFFKSGKRSSLSWVEAKLGPEARSASEA